MEKEYILRLTERELHAIKCALVSSDSYKEEDETAYNKVKELAERLKNR